MIEIANISKSYDKNVFALRDVSFKLHESTMTSIVGPSGCGKTTLLKILAGFLGPDTGSIYFDGRDVTGLPTQKRGVTMMFQNYTLWPHMTIFDNIAYGLKLKKCLKMR